MAQRWGIHMPLQQQHRLVVYTLNAQHGRGTIRLARLTADQHKKGTDLFVESLSTTGQERSSALTQDSGCSLA